MTIEYLGEMYGTDEELLGSILAKVKSVSTEEDKVLISFSGKEWIEMEGINKNYGDYLLTHAVRNIGRAKIDGRMFAVPLILDDTVYMYILLTDGLREYLEENDLSSEFGFVNVLPLRKSYDKAA